MLLENLYKLKEVLESGDKKEETKEDEVQELEDKIEDIDKKETRGFISEDEADEERNEIRKKLKAIKERVDTE